MDDEKTPEQETASPEQISAEAKVKARKWLDEITTREKSFEKGWWKAADEAAEIYNNGKESDGKMDVPYNILYSNSEVLLPSLFSATPKPDVRARFTGTNLKPIPEVIERFLTICADPASPGGESFSASMSNATLSAITSGLGAVRLRYYENKVFPLTFEFVHYRSLIWGKASRFAKTPWIAFMHKMHKDDMFEKFEIAEVDKVGFIPDTDCPDEEKDNATVYEFWHKETREVFYLSENWVELILDKAPDPMKLENFFPIPGLLQMVHKPGKMEPTTLYSYYKKQAEELNRVTVRLNKVLEAIKVRGMYSGLLNKDLENLLGSGDDMENKLIAAGEAAMLVQSGGLDKHIWMLPIDKMITVAQQLYQARESIKNVIYEITGISDIIRGSSVASETATAQDLKNKWGTVRLRSMQTEVANYARDLFRMAVDCGSTVIPAQKWKEITQLSLPLQAEKDAAKARLQQMQMQAQMQPPPLPGMPPPPPPSPPDPELLKTAQSPSFEEILQKISNDLNRTFVVNIQTSSTIDLDTAQDKSEVQEFMAAMGQLMPGLAPLQALGPSGLEAAKAILVSVLERFKFGQDVAEIVKKIEPPPAPGEDPGKKAEAEAAQAKTQMEMQALQAENTMKMKKLELDTQRMQAEHDFFMQEMAAKAEEVQIRLQLARLKLTQPQGKVQTGAQNAAV